MSVEDWPSDIWSLIVEGAARRGAVAEAWAALEAWSILALPDDHRPTARVVDLLTGAGAATEVEALLLDMADAARVSVPQENRVEEALAALAGHFAADDPQRSLALLHKAEHGPTSAAGPDSLFASNASPRSQEPWPQRIDPAKPSNSSGRLMSPMCELGVALPFPWLWQAGTPTRR